MNKLKHIIMEVKGSSDRDILVDQAESLLNKMDDLFGELDPNFLRRVEAVGFKSEAKQIRDLSDKLTELMEELAEKLNK